MRVIANSLTNELGQRLLGHRPEDIFREAIANENGRPIYKFSTDSPLRITTGDLECLALFAGQVAGAIETIPSAGAWVGILFAWRLRRSNDSDAPEWQSRNGELG